MNDNELQAWVEKVSLTSFGRPFRHKAKFNSRLSSTGGRYFTQSHHIEISSRHYEEHGAEETEKVIKHELCHYHLHLMGRGYQHRDAEFKQLLAEVGGVRFCKPLADRAKRIEPYRYRLMCQTCRMEYMRKRKVDPRKFLCGKCRGKLVLVPI